VGRSWLGGWRSAGRGPYQDRATVGKPPDRDKPYPIPLADGSRRRAADRRSALSGSVLSDRFIIKDGGD